jgi:hypothetical protein
MLYYARAQEIAETIDLISNAARGAEQPVLIATWLSVGRRWCRVPAHVDLPFARCGFPGPLGAAPALIAVSMGI